MKKAFFGATCTLIFLMLSVVTKPVISQPQGTLHYCAKNFPISLNPQLSLDPEVSNTVSRLMFDTLVEIDTTTGRVVPSLADSWDISDNGRVYTLVLRPDVQFQAGVQGTQFVATRTMNADDVLFSYRRQARSDHPYHFVGDGKYPYFDGMQMNWNILALDKLDDYTIQFTLRNSDASFLYNLAMDFAVIQSKEYADYLIENQAMDKIDRVPVSTGAYQLAEQSSLGTEQRLLLKANPLYWKGELPYAFISVDVIADAAERDRAYLSGKCQLLSPVEGEQIGATMDRMGDGFTHKEIMNVLYLSYSTQRSFLDSQYTRQAITSVLNLPRVAAIALGRAGTYAQELVPASHWLFNPEPLPPLQFSESTQRFQAEALEKLQQVLRKRPLRVLVSKSSKRYLLNPKSTGADIVAQLNQAGIPAEMDLSEDDVFLQKTQHGNYDLALLGWSGENGDLDNFLAPLLSCSQVNANNRSQWCNEDVDRWLKDGKLITDNEQRKVIYKRILRRVANRQPIVPIAHAIQYFPKKSGLKPIYLDIRGGIRWQWFAFPSLQEKVEEEVVIEAPAVPAVTIEELRTIE
jgi:cationic peptide transport system substrate-binding protein